jgi:aminoglycoside 2'-N-acetyltransferase I
MRVVRIQSAELTPEQARELRSLCERAWAAKGGDFNDEDWESCLGGTHVLVEDRAAFVSHAAVIERTLELDGAPLRTGFVEAVATLPERQGAGHASQVMRAVNEIIDDGFELGALDTGIPAFYERLGWVLWPGRTGVREPEGVRLTPQEDGKVLVRLPGRTLEAGRGSLLICDWRPGDPW